MANTLNAALATVVFGLLLALMNGYLLQALTFQRGTVAIGIGMWLALIMAFNVWFIVWPNDKKVLGIVEAKADEKAKAHRVAQLAGAHQHHALDPYALLHGRAEEFGGLGL
jgi:uncharacterized membrane protein